MMSSRHKRIEALRRLAIDPGATSAEKENAQRRIAEHEEKYGHHHRSDHGPRVRTSRVNDVGVNWDIFVNMVKRGVVWPGQAPFDYADFRGSTAPAEPAPVDYDKPFTGRKLSEFADYVCGRWRASTAGSGSFGIATGVACDSITSEHVTFSWNCPQCGSKATNKVPWQEASYAAAEPVAMDKLLGRLFAIWNGESNNWCEKCRRERAGARHGSVSAFEKTWIADCTSDDSNVDAEIVFPDGSKAKVTRFSCTIGHEEDDPEMLSRGRADEVKIATLFGKDKK